MKPAPSPAHTRASILVVEDEADLRDTMLDYLTLEGFVVAGVGTLAAAQAWLQQHPCDVLVLDLGLPDGDGLQWLRRQGEVPQRGVIITTARGTVDDRVLGVQTGADIYLVKPVQLAELAALLRRLLARLPTAGAAATTAAHTGTAVASASTGPVVWRLNPTSWMLYAPDGASVRLTHSEQVLLLQLATAPGAGVSRQAIAQALGHNPLVYDPRRLEIMIHRLRAKVKEQLGCTLPLDTVHRYGYAFTAPIEVQYDHPCG